MDSTQELQNQGKALVEMYQAGWYDGYCLKKTRRPIWRNVIRKCELCFNKRFPKMKSLVGVQVENTTIKNKTNTMELQTTKSVIVKNH